MSLLHQMAVSAAVRRTRTLAADETAPVAYPVIIDAFRSSSDVGYAPVLTVAAPTAKRAAALAASLSPDAASVTCRVPPTRIDEFDAYIAVHTSTAQAAPVEVTGMSLGPDSDIDTGTISVRRGPSNILYEILNGRGEETSAGLSPGEVAFLYTEDPHIERPFSGAFYWPTEEGYLLTAEADGLRYWPWQARIACLNELPDEDHIG